MNKSRHILETTLALYEAKGYTVRQLLSDAEQLYNERHGISLDLRKALTLLQDQGKLCFLFLHEENPALDCLPPYGGCTLSLWDDEGTPRMSERQPSGNAVCLATFDDYQEEPQRGPPHLILTNTGDVYHITRAQFEAINKARK